MYGAVRPLLFALDPERSHHLALAALRRLQVNSTLRRAAAAAPPSGRLGTNVLGLAFPNPIGVAAGFDKEARVHNALLALGFGHVEVGTVTPRPQPGNDTPRMQRFPAQRAIVNRLGFPGPGQDEVVRELRRHKPIGLVGANIGPNKTTSAADVPADLQAAATVLAPHVTYLAINVSSPNTPGLRALQTPTAVAQLVQRVVDSCEAARAPRPVLLKLHPDAPDADLVATAKAAVDAGAAGIIATNTTRNRPPGFEKAIDGGLSGMPLQERSRQAIAALHHGLGREVPILGVGGVFTGQDAYDHLRAGASLVQAYTGFVYRGPRMASHIQRELLAALDKAGADRVADVVGTA